MVYTATSVGNGMGFLEVVSGLAGMGQKSSGSLLPSTVVILGNSRGGARDWVVATRAALPGSREGKCIDCVGSWSL